MQHGKAVGRHRDDILLSYLPSSFYLPLQMKKEKKKTHCAQYIVGQIQLYQVGADRKMMDSDSFQLLKYGLSQTSLSNCHTRSLRLSV